MKIPASLLLAVVFLVTPHLPDLPTPARLQRH
jgi:hypothetical protein